MTHTDPPSELDEVVVTGQRLQPNGLFPAPSGGGGGIPGDDGGIHQDELDPDNLGPDPSPPHPCDDPVGQKIWNADARAAMAVADLMNKAASLNDGSNLANREFGANLFLNSNGNIDLTEVSVGPTPTPGSIPEVTIEPGGTTYLNWMGDIHNHPSGDGRLSAGEWARFNDRIDAIQNLHPQRSELNAIAAYVVVLDANAPAGYRIYAHKKGDSQNSLGQEVNPDAQPCPAT